MKTRNYTASRKGYGSKRQWRIPRHYPGMCLEGLRKTNKTSGRIAGLRAEI
jgi:hypothetical protein